jgi:hypothetical protein
LIGAFLFLYIPCAQVSAQVLSGLTIAETMARASDVALLFFGSTSSQRVFVTLAMSSALRCVFGSMEYASGTEYTRMAGFFDITMPGVRH